MGSRPRLEPDREADTEPAESPDASAPRPLPVLPGGSWPTASEFARLRTETHARHIASAALRETSAERRRTADSARETARLVGADSRRLRGELFRVRLPRDATSGAAARRLLEDHLDVNPAEIHDAKTVVSELVNNALVHGEGRIQLWVSRRRGRVRIAVQDEGTDAAVRAGTDDRPHGLDIVEALSLRWGAHAGSTYVWAELPTNGHVRSA